MSDQPSIRTDGMKKEFDQAKMLSDFIGFIVRWSFALFAIYYVIIRLSKGDNYYNLAILAAFGLAAAGVLVVFSYRIFMVIFHYNMRYADKAKESKPLFLTYLTLAAIETYLVFNGALLMVREIARASTLLAH